VNIKSLDIKNIGKIGHFSMSPDGGSVTIKGPNNSGKTTILSAIALCLSQVKGAEILPKMVKEGKDIGIIKMMFTNGLEVERHVRSDNSTKKLVVKNADGSRMNQGLLNKMFSLISFKLDSTITYDQLRTDAGLDFNQIEIDKRVAFEARRVAKIDLKSAVSVLLSLGELSDKWPTKEPDMKSLLAEQTKYNAMRERNRETKTIHDNSVTKDTSDRGILSGKVKGWKDMISEKEREIEVAQKRLKNTKDSLKSAQKSLTDIDIEIEAVKEPKYEKWEGAKDLENEILSVTDQTDLFNKRTAHDTASKDKSEKEIVVTKSEKAVTAVNKAEREMVSSADFGLPGLSLDPETKAVLFNNLPFDSCSKSEGLLIGLQWLAARNPEMKFATTVQIEDYLDDANFRIFHDKAKELGIQIINEQVRSIDPSAIEIVEEA
jgi:predicted ATP-dependent endonuclease of OLD family